MSIDRVNDTTDGTQMLRLSEQTREFSEQTSLEIKELKKLIENLESRIKALEA